MANKTAIDVRLEFMENEIRELKTSIKDHRIASDAGFSAIMETLHIIDSKMIVQDVVCTNRADVQKDNTDRIRKLEKSDVVQNEKLAVVKEFIVKWGPILSILSYFFIKEIK